MVQTSHVHELLAWHLAETTSIKSSCCVTRTCISARGTPSMQSAQPLKCVQLGHVHVAHTMATHRLCSRGLIAIFCVTQICSSSTWSTETIGVSKVLQLSMHTNVKKSSESMLVLMQLVYLRPPNSYVYPSPRVLEYFMGTFCDLTVMTP